MRLKRRQDIEWNDLPKIESPFFARHWVEQNINVNGFGLHWVHGLKEVLWDRMTQTHLTLDEHAIERLIERVERAEVLLVHGLGSDPALPALRRIDNSENDAWLVVDSINWNARSNMEWMVQEALRSKGILTPPNVTSKPIPPRPRPVVPAQQTETPQAEEEVVVRVGVFFDGTGNNMFNDKPKGRDTNIVRLYELYQKNGKPESEPVGKQDGLTLFTSKVYKNGVGTTDGQEKNSAWGAGTGAEGIKRIREAMHEVELFFAKFAGSPGPRIVDVFGFSRGAALARDFVNQINSRLGRRGVEVGFVGLFDTVASFGVGGNNVNSRSDQPLVTGALGVSGPVIGAGVQMIFGEFELNLGPDSAKQIVHLVADDEKRANFPLHSLRSGKDAPLPGNMEEMVVVGAHSDVGGGYGPVPIEETDLVERRHIRYQMLGQQWQAEMLEAKSRLEAEAASKGLELLYDDSNSNAIGEVTDNYWLAERHIVKPGLSNVYLHWMYQKAQEAKVPWVDINNSIDKEPVRFAIPHELQSLFQPDLATANDHQKLRREYVHRSHRDWEDADQDHRWLVHRPESNGEPRTVFYNEPDKARTPVRREVVKRAGVVK